MESKNYKNKKLRSLRTKLLISVLAVIISILLVIFITNYISTAGEMEEDYEILQKRVETNVERSLTLIDKAYKMIETYYEEMMKEPFQPFLEEYERSGRNPDKMDLQAVKEKIGGDIDLYIIENGVITHSTFNPDSENSPVGLDFKQWGNFYDRIEKIRKGDEIVVDRITPDITTGELKVWSYMPTPDSKYLFELGLTSDKVSQIVKEMDIMEIMSEIVKVNPILVNLRIFDTDAIEVGNATAEASEELKEAIKKTIEKGEYRKSVTDNTFKKYIFIDFDDKSKPTNISHIVEFTYDTTSMNTKLLRASIYYLVVTILSIVIVIIVITLITKKITKPIIKLQEISDSLKQGDLTNKVNICSNDEIGVLSNYFNEFITNLNSTMKEIKDSTNTAKSISMKLSLTSNQSASSLEEMRSNIENIKDKTIVLDNELDSSNKSTKDVKKFISNVVELISTQVVAVNQSSQSLQSMYDSIQNVTNLSEEKLKIAQKLEDTASKGQNEMKEAMSTITKVAESADLIMEMIEVINGIAKKTNLLAMNASIEAAHAGHSGKGFAVVATEIRKLAEDTAKNSKEISDSLKEVIDYIHISEETTDKTGNLFAGMVNEIKEVAHSIAEIKNDMNELSAGSNQVRETLNKLVNLTENVQSSSDEMDNRISKITESTQNINDISSDVKQGMEEINTGINELYSMIQKVSDAGLENAESVKKIEILLERFKVNKKTPKKPALIEKK